MVSNVCRIAADSTDRSASQVGTTIASRIVPSTVATLVASDMRRTGAAGAVMARHAIRTATLGDAFVA